MSRSPQQLDIFEHSSEVVLRNDVLDALLRRDAAMAMAACRKLAATSPVDGHRAALELLVKWLCQQQETHLGDPEAAARERRCLADVIAPAAASAFSAGDAEAFMRLGWRQLAGRCSAIPFHPSQAEDHAASLWLRGGAWAEAAHAVERIESWRRIPVPLAWMAEARCRLGKLDETWALLAELGWLSPRRLDGVVRRARDPLLTRLHKKFGSSFDDHGDLDDLAWFAAWVLTETPALAGPLGLAWPSQDTPAERGMRLMVELLGLERRGRHAELIARRRALRELSQPLYDAYIATR